MLVKAQYPEGFSLGLVTASGSLGLLFPPSLPVILYGVVAGVPADALFLGRPLARPAPRSSSSPPTPFASASQGGAAPAVRRHARSARALWAAKYELGLPLAGGRALRAAAGLSIVEASAAACALRRRQLARLPRRCDLRLQRAAARAGRSRRAGGRRRSILLSVALGLTSYLVDAQIPEPLARMGADAHPLAAGVPAGAQRRSCSSSAACSRSTRRSSSWCRWWRRSGGPSSVDPIHLGVIFLANLELGFLLPADGAQPVPVGLALRQAAALRCTATRAVPAHPGVGVLLITYVPAMSLGVLKLLGK